LQKPKGRQKTTVSWKLTLHYDSAQRGHTHTHTRTHTHRGMPGK